VRREANVMMTDGKPKGRKFSKAEIRKGLQELKDLYKHDYKSPMPKPLIGAGFVDDIEAERALVGYFALHSRNPSRRR